MDIASILSLISGPFGALAICCVIGWVIYKKGFPLIEKFLASLLDEHAKDRDTYKESMEKITQSIDLLCTRIEFMDVRLKELEDVLKEKEDKTLI